MDFDLEHYGTIISGCESFSAGGRGPEAAYAVTVLKLHAQDAGLVAGTEGFAEAVRKGASNTKDWIIKFIKALRDFFTGGYAKVKKLVNDISGFTNKEIVVKHAKTTLGPLNTAKGLIKIVYDDREHLPKAYSSKISELNELLDNATTLIGSNISGHDAPRIVKMVSDILTQSQLLSKALSDEWNSDKDKPATDPKAKEIMNIGRAAVNVGKVLNVASGCIGNWYDKINKDPEIVGGGKKPV